MTVRAHGKPVGLTTVLPGAAKASTTLGKGPDLPRNECVTAVPAYGLTFFEDCGYPMIIGTKPPTPRAHSWPQRDGTDQRPRRLVDPPHRGLAARIAWGGRLLSDRHVIWPRLVADDALLQLGERMGCRCCRGSRTASRAAWWSW